MASHATAIDRNAEAREALASAALTPALLLKAFVPAIVALNALNLVAVFRFHEGHTDDRFFELFSLDREANVPSWFSSALLLSAAGLVALVALDAAERRDRWRRHWAGLVLVYLVLSVDETAEFHERIGSWLRAQLDLGGPLRYAGIIPMLAFAVLVTIAYARFVLALPPQTRSRIVLAAVVFVAGAAGVEALTGWWSESGEHATTTLLISTVEENLELAGTVIFMFAVLGYHARHGRAVTLRAEG